MSELEKLRDTVKTQIYQMEIGIIIKAFEDIGIGIVTTRLYTRGERALFELQDIVDDLSEEQLEKFDKYVKDCKQKEAKNAEYRQRRDAEYLKNKQLALTVDQLCEALKRGGFSDEMVAKARKTFVLERANQMHYESL